MPPLHCENETKSTNADDKNGQNGSVRRQHVAQGNSTAEAASAPSGHFNPCSFQPKTYSNDFLTNYSNWRSIPARPGWRMVHDWVLYRIFPTAAGAWIFTQSLACVFGAIMVAPTLALAQGARGILGYRFKFGGSPTPKAPSHGVVRTVSTAATSTGRSPKNDPVSQTPLRLLVIGDSLAIGVGQRQSATPVMPEIIAKQLSKAMNGRPVMWTCHGAPGASAGWIVRELDRGAFQQQIAESMESITRTAAAETESTTTSSSVEDDSDGGAGTDDNGSDTMDEANSVDQQFADDEHSNFEDNMCDKQTWSDRLKEHRIQFDPQLHTLGPFDVAVIITGSNDVKSTFFPFLLQGEDAEFRRQARERGGGYGIELSRVLASMNTLMRKRIQTIQESVSAVSQRMRDISMDRLRHSNEDLNSNSNGGTEDSNRQQEQCRPPTSINIKPYSHESAELQEKLLSERRSARTVSYQSIDAGDARDDDGHDDGHSENFIRDVKSHRSGNRSFPVVILPGMPSRALPAFEPAPLRWMNIPIVDIMDVHKRRLASSHPGEVLFVDPPNAEDMIAFKREQGLYWQDKQAERTLLNLRDIKRRHARRLQSDMKEYYEQRECRNKEPSKLMTVYQSFLRPVEWLLSTEKKDHHDMFSGDGVHPTDHGYEFWGRYIGHAIVREYKQQTSGQEEHK